MLLLGAAEFVVYSCVHVNIIYKYTTTCTCVFNFLHAMLDQAEYDLTRCKRSWPWDLRGENHAPAAPSRPNLSAIASPIPAVEPVTIATFPLNRLQLQSACDDADMDYSLRFSLCINTVRIRFVLHGSCNEQLGVSISHAQ
jgi:hypothetical protein